MSLKNMLEKIAGIEGSPAAGFQLFVLMRNLWKHPEAIDKIRVAKTRRLLIHAYENVPFYRNLFRRRNADPYAFRTMEDLARFPVVSKDQLRDRPVGEITAAGLDPARCRRFSTSGTTGIPLRTFFSRRDIMMKNLAWIRVYLNSGMKPWHKTAAFVGSRETRPSRSWYEYLGLWRRREISTWAPPADWIKDLRTWKPQTLLGYVMTLRILAEQAVKDGGPGIRPKRIFHSSAVLDEASRAFLEKALGGPIIDIYGSDEAGCIAWECPICRGYHINADMLAVEVVKNGCPAAVGESGEVLVTNLHSYAMPFIRYQQNDIVTVSSRSPQCGRSFPLIERIEGRSDDFIILDDGRKISPHPLYHAIDSIPGIHRWRLTQETKTALVLEIEPGPGFSPTFRRRIESRIRGLTAESLTLHIAMRDKLNVDPGAKFRAVTSKVPG